MKTILSLVTVVSLFHLPLGAVEYRSISTVGTICPEHKSCLGSVVSGRVDEVLVDVGDRVTKGQELLKLDTTFFSIALKEAEDALVSAQVERVDAERNFERMKKLFAKPEGQTPSISQKRFEDAGTRYEQSLVSQRRAEENLQRAKANLKEATIRAPYNGVVTKRLVHPGEAVNAAPVTKVLEMESIDTLYVEFSVPQVQMAKLQVGSHVELQIEGTTQGTYSAAIDLICPDVDEKTRSIKCRTFLNNADRLFHPGSLVRITIPLSEASRVSL
jgi:membrane fusion protein (multidrug efflux system)